MKQRPQLGRVHHALHLFERALVAALVADTEDDAPVVARGEHAPGRIGAERQRFFAEHLLAGRRGGQHLFLVQTMGGGQNDGVDGAVPQNLVVSIGQLQGHFIGKRADGVRIDVDGADQIDPVAVFETGDDLFAPPSEADDGGFQHMVCR